MKVAKLSTKRGGIRPYAKKGVESFRKAPI